MAGKIQNGFELSKQSWGALLENKQLIVFPVISMIGMLVVTVLFFIPEAVIVGPVMMTAESSNFQWIAAIVVLFVYYLMAYFVTIFSNTALVGATLKMIQGEESGVRVGLSIAASRLGKIFIYAMISATVGVIARSITSSGRRSDNFIVAILAAILGGMLQGAWNLVVFFAIPVLVVEDLGLVDSLKRSFELFKQTWGEGFVGNAAIGGISCLAYVAVFVIGGGLIAGGVATGFIPLIVLGIVFLLLGFVTISLLSGAVNGIFQASLYNFAATGDAGPFINTELAREAFQVG